MKQNFVKAGVIIEQVQSVQGLNYESRYLKQRDTHKLASFVMDRLERKTTTPTIQFERRASSVKLLENTVTKDNYYSLKKLKKAE